MWQRHLSLYTHGAVSSDCIMAAGAHRCDSNFRQWICTVPSQNCFACQVVHRGVAERSGLRDGDLVTYIAGNRIPASPMSVGSLVEVIKCAAATAQTRLQMNCSALRRESVKVLSSTRALEHLARPCVSSRVLAGRQGVKSTNGGLYH